MSAVFGNDVVFDYDDLVDVAQCAEAVGGGDQGAALHQPFKGVGDEFFGAPTLSPDVVCS